MLRLSKREGFLRRDREKKKRSRKKLKEMALKNDKSSLAKINKVKNQLHERYIENKKLGKCKEYDMRRRRKKLLTRIERQIKIERKPVDEP